MRHRGILLEDRKKITFRALMAYNGSEFKVQSSK